MNLRKASFLLIVGLIYVLFYKFIYTLFPNLNNKSFVEIILSVLWFVATYTMILFAFYFIKEIHELSNKVINYLKAVIFLTLLLLMGKLFFNILPGSITVNKYIFDFLKLLNTLSILLFLVSFNKILMNNIPIKKAAQLAIWGYTLSFLLGLISFSFYTIFFITNKEITSSPFITLSAVFIFIFTIITAVNFLIRLRNIKDFTTVII